MAAKKKTSAKSGVKKIVKKVAPVDVPKKSWWTILGMGGAEHWHFLAVLLLFSAFSLYAFGSYFSSTNRYIDSYYASVVDSDDDDEEDEDKDKDDDDDDGVVNLPQNCATCERGTTDLDKGEGAAVKDIYEIFTDVLSDNPYAEAIENLRDAGVISGFSDGSFKPEATLNRAELITILANAADADFAGKTYEKCFKDVQSEWFAVFVCYAKEKSWVKGYGDGSYKPDQAVTKAEALKIVLATFGFEIPTTFKEVPFGDVSATDWYAPYAVVAKEKEIVKGNSVGFFDAAHELSRSEFASIVYKAMKSKGLF